MLPRKGPQSFTVSALSVPLTAGSSSPAAAFRWPRPLFVTSVLVLPDDGARATMAKLRLRIQDETQQDMIFDGLGAHEASALELSGLTPLSFGGFADLQLVRPYVLQRPVNTGDLWYVTITNDNAFSVTPEVVFGFEEGTVRK